MGGVRVSYRHGGGCGDGGLRVDSGGICDDGSADASAVAESWQLFFLAVAGFDSTGIPSSLVVV
jgi:hypothetical protein